MNARLEQAKIESERARKRVASTLGALQHRLRPATLANQAWSGVREKGSELADDAVQAVKERPIASSGLLAAFALFLAREPILSAASRLFSRGGGTNEDATDEESRPRGGRTTNEGVNA